MATSGQVVGNNLGQGKYAFVNWQLAQQDIGGNRSLINWQAYAHFTNSDSQLDNGGVGSAQVGMLWQNGGRVKNYQGTFTTRDVGLASGSFWVGHNSDGTQSLEMSVGIDYYQTGRSSGSGWFGLPQIPRNAYLTNLSQDINDLANPWVEFSNAGGFQVNAWLEAGGARRFQMNGVGSRHTWNLTEAQRDVLRALTPNSNTMGIRYVIETLINGVYTPDYRDRIYSIVEANPIFTDFTYKDKNPTTVAITGNDQYFVQGYSELEVSIPSANKATPKKFATMTKYNSSVSNLSQDTPYSTNDIVQAVGVLGVNSDTPLVVKAIDSRGNQTAVSKTLTVLPYVAPQVTATARRVNNFETSTNIHIEGVVSRLTVAGVDKNAVNNASGVQYRFKKTTDANFGAWVNRPSTVNNGNVSSADFAINLDRNFAWNVEFRISDKVTSTSFALIVSVGIPIFRIGLDGKIYNNEVVMATINDLVQSQKYAFKARRDGSSVTPSGDFMDVVCNSEDYDTGNCYSNVTGLFTAPINGVYSFTFTAFTETNQTGRSLSFSRGTVAVTERPFDQDSSWNRRTHGKWEVYMQAGQTFGVGLWTSNPNELSNKETWFAGHLVQAVTI